MAFRSKVYSTNPSEQLRNSIPCWGRSEEDPMLTKEGTKNRSIEVSRVNASFRLDTSTDREVQFFSIFVILPVRLDIVLDISSIFFNKSSTSVLVARERFMCAV